MRHSEPVRIEQLLEHESWLRGIAARLAREGSEVDELVQETWLVAMRRPPGDGGGDPRGWLWRVLQNVQRQLERSRLRRSAREELAASSSIEELTPAQIEERIDLRRQVLEALGDVPAELRRVLVLRHFEGLSMRQIAQQAGRPLETVKSQHTRALNLLRGRLDRVEGDERSWLSAYGPLFLSKQTGAFLMSTTSKLALSAAAVILIALSVHRWGGAGEVPSEVGSSAIQTSPALSLEAQLTPSGSERRLAELESSTSTEVVDSLAADVPKRVLSGRVLTSDGLGVIGARIGAEDEQQATSLRGGYFTWQVGDEAKRLGAELEGMTCIVEAWARPNSDGELLIVMAPSMELAGLVVDGEDRPIEGAQLRFQLLETWGRELPRGIAGGSVNRWFAQSDSEGAFRLPLVPKGVDALLWVSHAGETSIYQPPKESRNDLRFVISEPSEDERWAGIEHLSGRALLSSAAPASGARVYSDDYSRECDDNGLFRIPMSTLENSKSFVVLLRGHLPHEVRKPGEADSPWPSYLEVRLPEAGLGQLGGRVVDETGRGLENRSVWLLNPTPLSNQAYPHWIESLVGTRVVETDANGRFQLSALPGREYSLAVFDKETMKRVELSHAVEGDLSLELVVSREIEERELSGRVFDRKGVPLSGVEVTPQWMEMRNNRQSVHDAGSTTSNELGGFHFDSMPVGFDSMEFEGREVMPVTLTMSFDQAQAGPIVLQRRADLRVRSDREGASYFMLKDADGESAELYRFQWIMDGTVEGSAVTHWGELESGSSTTYTVAEGTYELQLYVGETLVNRKSVDILPAQQNEFRIE